MSTIITGTGSYIPSLIKTNKEFTDTQFYDENFAPIEQDGNIVVEKFQQITGIEERRYAQPSINASDMATASAIVALDRSNIDRETLDQIIVAHNFGNVVTKTIQTDILPALASRVKHDLGIKNPNCVAYDILFGCPGWIQGVIQAHHYFLAGVAQKALIIGTETLSRVLDKHDRDSMIFSDGAGACILENQPNANHGILSVSVQSHCIDEAYYLYLGKSNYPESDPSVRYIKMKGRKVFEYAMRYVPLAMKDCLDKANISITDVKKVFIHQANEKMDEGIIKALFKLYGLKEIPEHIMPMSIHKLGNSSVATVPTLFDLVLNGQLEHHSLQTGDIVLFASVGAGMNINAFCYRM